MKREQAELLQKVVCVGCCLCSSSVMSYVFRFWLHQMLMLKRNMRQECLVQSHRLGR